MYRRASATIRDRIKEEDKAFCLPPPRKKGGDDLQYSAKKKYKKHPLIIFIMAHCSIAILVLAGLCIAVVSGFSLSKSKARGVA